MMEESDASGPPSDVEGAEPLGTGAIGDHRPGKRRVPCASAAATPRAAVAVARCISATLKPVRVTDSCTLKDRNSAALKACQSAIGALKAEAFPSWVRDGTLQKAIAALETGQKKKGPHLQYGGTHLSTETTDAGAVKEFKSLMRDFLKVHNADGKVKWSLREVHVHDDPLYLEGYCWKDSMKGAGSVFRCAFIGTDEAHLHAAYKYYVNKALKNEGGEASMKVSRPGQGAEVLIITRSSRLGDAELFDDSNGFGIMNLSVGQLVYFMVSEGQAQLHPMYASGATSGVVDPVLDNLWYMVRRDYRGVTLRMVNKLLYGAQYGDAEDEKVHAMLREAHPEGIDPAVSARLTFAEASLAVRTGALPSRLQGTLLQRGLKDFSGRALVIGLHGDPATADCVRLLAGMRLLTVAHGVPTARPDAHAYVAAGAARMLGSTRNAHTLTEAALNARLAHPGLVAMMNAMLHLDGTGAAPRALTREQVLELSAAYAPVAAEAEHHWLREPELTHVEMGDDVVPFRALVAEVQESLSTLVDDPVPDLHVRIVEAMSGGFFVVAWQLSLARVHTLREQAAASAAGAAPAPPAPAAPEPPPVPAADAAMVRAAAALAAAAR